MQMKDFLKNHKQKEICSHCKQDYLKSAYCRKCYAELFINDLLEKWCNEPDFKAVATYDGINLGELSQYELRPILVAALKRLIGDEA